MASRQFVRKQNGQGNWITASHINELQVALEEDDQRIETVEAYLTENPPSGGGGAVDGESIGQAVAGFVANHPTIPDAHIELFGVRADGRLTDYSIANIEELLASRGNMTRGTFDDRSTSPRILDTNGLALIGSASATTWDTYDGSDVIVHPCVRFIPNGFGGYQWWAAATPYPGANPDRENPSIFVSTNGTNWAPPPGLTNPLAPDPDPGASLHHNSDPYITMGPDGLMYMYFRESRTSTWDEWIKVMSTSDGVTWTDPVTVHRHTGTAMVRHRMSPSIWYDANADEWVMLLVDFATTGTPNPATEVLTRLTCATPDGTFLVDDTVPVTPIWSAGRNIWHIEAIPMGSQVIAIAEVAASSGLGGESYLLVSNDGGRSFTRATNAIAGSVSDHYKSSIVPIMTERGLGFDLWLGLRPAWGAVRGTIAREIV